MKLIALGDTHGRDTWKKIVNNEEFDKLVFIGDYFDSFNIEAEDQINNFMDIIELKKNNLDKVILLIGNHDAHYTRYFRQMHDRYSGFQSYHQPTIEALIEGNMQYLQMAYLHENFLFTHAGVTQDWITDTLKEDEYNDFNSMPIDEYINLLWLKYRSFFLFRGYDPYGDDVNQSPIWVRPNSLNKAAHGRYTQVVGHTGQTSIDKEKSHLFIDTLGTSKEYLIIDDNKVKVKKYE